MLTDLIDQGVPIEDVQELAGHADARTNRKVTRNLVERIRLKMTPGGDVPTDDPDDKKVMKAELSLRIERNSKFVRGMKPSRESI